jgi:hypothetical protein
MNAYLDSAQKLYDFLHKEFWNGEAFIGPDIGIRFNFRFWRFIKSYLAFIPWTDNLVYMQAQGYWILANWALYDLTKDEQYKDIALACSNHVLKAQHSEGFWDYPNPEWGGRVATVEGDFAAIGLLESYQRTQSPALLDGAQKWYRYLVTEVGFQEEGDFLAVNYFAGADGVKVPNNSTMTLWFLAKLADTTENSDYLEYCKGMINWLHHVQLESGELPYATAGAGGKDRTHFLCYQYNSFQLLDLAAYFRITNDQQVVPIIRNLAKYLSTGLTDSGACLYNCNQDTPETVYYTMAIGTALSEATRLGLGDYSALAKRAFRRALMQQRPDGGFLFFSKGNYRFLSDRRSYPRHLAMVLHHLLLEVIFQ